MLGVQSDCYDILSQSQSLHPRWGWLCVRQVRASAITFYTDVQWFVLVINTALHTQSPRHPLHDPSETFWLRLSQQLVSSRTILYKGCCKYLLQLSATSTWTARESQSSLTICCNISAKINSAWIYNEAIFGGKTLLLCGEGKRAEIGKTTRKL